MTGAEGGSRGLPVPHWGGVVRSFRPCRIITWAMAQQTLPSRIWPNPKAPSTTQGDGHVCLPRLEARLFMSLDDRFPNGSGRVPPPWPQRG